MNRRMTEDQAKKTFERSLKMEQEFGEYFTGKEVIKIKHEINAKKNFRSRSRRHNRGDLQQSQANDLVTIRQGNLGSIERISMTARNHQVDTSRAGEAAAHLEESTISLKFISLNTQCTLTIHTQLSYTHKSTQQGVHSIKKISLSLPPFHVN